MNHCVSTPGRQLLAPGAKGCRSFASIQRGAALQLYEGLGRAGWIAHQLSRACPRERHLPADLAGSKSNGKKRS